MRKELSQKNRHKFTFFLLFLFHLLFIIVPIIYFFLAFAFSNKYTIYIQPGLAPTLDELTHIDWSLHNWTNNLFFLIPFIVPIAHSVFLIWTFLRKRLLKSVVQYPLFSLSFFLLLFYFFLFPFPNFSFAGGCLQANGKPFTVETLNSVGGQCMVNRGENLVPGKCTSDELKFGNGERGVPIDSSYSFATNNFVCWVKPTDKGVETKLEYVSPLSLQ